MLLLLWTAVDLSSASLCALDNEAQDVVPFAADAQLQDGELPLAPVPAPPAHIDDCFCCSHCVEVQPFAPAMVVMTVGERRPPLFVAVPRPFGSPLYHPPLV